MDTLGCCHVNWIVGRIGAGMNTDQTLDEIVDAIRKELQALRTENAELREKLSATLHDLQVRTVTESYWRLYER